MMKANLPEKYVVITTGFTSKTREWSPESVNGVVDYIDYETYKISEKVPMDIPIPHTDGVGIYLPRVSTIHLTKANPSSISRWRNV